jgi:hypothetical protein
MSMLLILLFSCTAKKVTPLEKEIIDINGCPPKGICNIERIENSTIKLLEDTTGQFYTKVETDENHHLYKITYEREVPEGIMDAQYQEIIYFQVEKDKKLVELNDKELSEANVIYSRLCYCPGETGYEVVAFGSLYFETKKQSTEIRLEIQPKKYPVKMNLVETTVVF